MDPNRDARRWGSSNYFEETRDIDRAVSPRSRRCAASGASGTPASRGRIVEADQRGRASGVAALADGPDGVVGPIVHVAADVLSEGN